MTSAIAAARFLHWRWTPCVALVAGALAFVGLAVALVPGSIGPLAAGARTSFFEQGARARESSDEAAPRTTRSPAPDGIVTAPVDSPPPPAPEATQPHLVRSFFFVQKDDMPPPAEDTAAPPEPPPAAPTATTMEAPPPPTAETPLPITPPDPTTTAAVVPEAPPTAAVTDAGAVR